MNVSILRRLILMRRTVEHVVIRVVATKNVIVANVTAVIVFLLLCSVFVTRRIRIVLMIYYYLKYNFVSAHFLTGINAITESLSLSDLDMFGYQI